MPQLVDTVEELQEDLRAVALINYRVVPAPSAKHVSKGEPFFLDQDLKSLESSIVWI